MESNETVFTVLSSHVADHNISPGLLNFVQTHPELLAMPVTLDDEGKPNNFILKVFPIPEEELGSMTCALYGPAAGDEPITEDKVFYEARGNRRGPSRLIRAGERPAKNVVVIGLRGGVCFTMYGTQADSPSPKEPWDAANPEELEKCLEFWNQHCLAEANPSFLGEPSYTHGQKFRTPIHFGDSQ